MLGGLLRGMVAAGALGYGLASGAAAQEFCVVCS